MYPILNVKDENGTWHSIKGIKGDPGQCQVSNIVLGVNWKQEGNYFTQTVELQGISSLDYPIIYLDYDISLSQNEGNELNNEYTKIVKAVAEDNQIKFFVKSMTTKPLNLQVMHHEVKKCQSLFNVDQIYPIGSIYMNINNVEPSELFGGTWQKIAQGQCLFGANGTTHKVGETKASGLPNITGEFAARMDCGFGASTPHLGAFGVNTKNEWSDNIKKELGVGGNSLTFNAHNSNAIYGASNIVQPPCLVVNIWERIG